MEDGEREIPLPAGLAHRCRQRVEELGLAQDAEQSGSIIDLTARVRTTPAEQEVPITVSRDGEDMTLAVTLTTSSTQQ